MARSIHPLIGSGRRLWRRRDGMVLAWVAVLVPVLLGLGALVIDLSRLYSLQTELQNAADAAALQAAAELDGRPSAIGRADAALANMAANTQAFGSAGKAPVTVSGHRYLSALPASDASPITAAFNTTIPANAHYIEVTVTPVQMNFILPIVGGLQQAITGAVAVAGFKATVCQFTPMFMCNPYEGTGTSIFTASTNELERRRLYDLRPHGGGNNVQYVPGNYGFLDSPIGNGASALRDALASANPPTCFQIDGVTQRPGTITSASQGFNVRFDMYNGSFSGKKNDTNYRPARNVVRGYVGNSCNASASTQAYGLPQDACFATGTCGSLGASGSRRGDGNWDFVTYMQRDHNSPPSVTMAIAATGQTRTYAINYTTRTIAPSTLPSRYDVYRWEIDNNRIPNVNGYTQPNTKEKGAPQCHTANDLSDTPDRRLLYVAVLDCNALTASGLMTGGNGSNTLPVTAFAKMFLTEPADKQNASEIYGEFTGLVEPGRDGGVVHDQVKLYR